MATLLLVVCWACGGSSPEQQTEAQRLLGEALLEQSVERTLAFFPSRALAAGHYASAGSLESRSQEDVDAWVAWNRELLARAQELLPLLEAPMLFDVRADLELAAAEARRQLFDYEQPGLAVYNPLMWSGVAANSVSSLLVRERLDLDQRVAAVTSRLGQIPRWAREADVVFMEAPLEEVSPDLLRLAAGQLSSTAEFFTSDLSSWANREGAGEEAVARLDESSRLAAAELRQLAARFTELSGEALGSFRLGDRYAERFRVVTGEERSVDEVLAAAEADLRQERGKAALFARRVLPQYVDEPLPFGDAAVLRTLFARIAEDRAKTIEEFVADYRTLVDQAESFVREKQLVNLPDPLTLQVDRSPAHFGSQAFGGVYSTGPWDPEADTLLLLPTPSADADEEQLARFFSDFNHHFNVMIIAHELIPGHYLQLKVAARSSRPARFLYADDVFVEGWGTFSERLMLEAGWGDDLAYAAHLKKQLENIARTIVDIRVHTRNMTRQQVIDFVTTEAGQDLQFAENMWRRAMTTSPQLTYYWLGDRTIAGLFQDYEQQFGDELDRDALTARFTNAMMEVGPVALEDVRLALGLATEAHLQNAPES